MTEVARTRDTLVRCEECGTEFVWTLGEQRQATGGLVVPRLCPGCRVLARRLAERAQAGVVKWFDGRKGFGFITSDEGEDLFVRRSALGSGITMLRRGQRVTFVTRHAEKGPEAAEVRLVRPDAAQDDAGQCADQPSGTPAAG